MIDQAERRAARAAYMRRYRAAHPEKEREHVRRWYEANAEKRRESMAAYRQANLARIRENDRQYYETIGLRWTQHGVSPERAEAIWLAQGKACAGCGQPAESKDALSVDHDHMCCSGGYSCGRCVRALLCGTCNTRDVLNPVRA